MEKSCVYFMFANGTEISTEIIHEKEMTEYAILYSAKKKLIYELGINVDLLVKLVGKNDCHDGKWYFVDFIEYL